MNALCRWGLRLFAAAGILVGLPLGAWGHGTPVEVRSSAGRLEIARDPETQLPSFEPGHLTAQPLAGMILSDTPGIAVADGAIEAGSEISLRAVGPLVYWDGAQVRPTEATLEIVSPNGASSLVLSGTSAAPQEMVWGTYTGEPHWHAHGLFILDPITAPPGIYGATVQVGSPAYQATPEFLLPLVYDPQGTFSASAIELGIQALSRPARRPGDVDGDGDVDSVDLTAVVLGWTGALDPGQGGRLWGDGDFDGDGDVDSVDLTTLTLGWTGAPPSPLPPSPPAPVAVPEPTGAALGIGMLGLLALSFRKRAR